MPESSGKTRWPGSQPPDRYDYDPLNPVPTLGGRSLQSGKLVPGPFDQFHVDRFILGDEAWVKDELERYRDTLGVQHFTMRMQWPGLEQNLVLESIERLGRVVASIR